MAFLRFIIWSIILFIGFRIFKSISSVVKAQAEEDKRNSNTSFANVKSKIDSKDIIDAEFEDLTPPKK